MTWKSSPAWPSHRLTLPPLDVEEDDERPPYRRRVGVIFRRGNLGGGSGFGFGGFGGGAFGRGAGPVLDGGHDAPMGPRDRKLFEIIFVVAGVVGIALILLAVFE